MLYCASSYELRKQTKAPVPKHGGEREEQGNLDKLVRVLDVAPLSSRLPISVPFDPTFTELEFAMPQAFDFRLFRLIHMWLSSY